MPPADDTDPSPAAAAAPLRRDRFVGTREEASRVPILPAATVMLVRDGAADPASGATLEVCMLRRNLASAFMGGAHVFPGGAVEASDADPAALTRCIDAPSAKVEQAGGLAFWVAAIRETFEEAGLLPAVHAGTDRPLALPGQDARSRRFADLRRRVDAGELGLGPVLEAEDLWLDLSGVHFVARWITPLGLIRRYDTRFFVAAAPPGQVATQDGTEAVDAAWLRPPAVLGAHAAGEVQLRFPTVASLRMLAESATADAALAAAAAVTDPPVIDPPPVGVAADAPDPRMGADRPDAGRDAARTTGRTPLDESPGDVR